MHVTTIADQEFCRWALGKVGIKNEVSPITPGSTATDGMVQLDVGVFLIVCNQKGSYTIHILEEASAEQAWDYFAKLLPPNVVGVNARMNFIGATPAMAASN